MLKDEDYLNALDNITGKNIAVFTTALFPGQYTSPSSTSGRMSMMYKIWQEPEQNKELLSWFDIDSSKKLPLLVLFGIDFKNNDLYWHTYSIKAESPLITYNLLQQVLSVTSAQVQENTNLDKIALFNKARLEIRKIQATQFLSKLIPLFASLRGAINI